MIGQLNVYENPASEEPTKVYKLHRLTPYTKGLVQDFLFKKFKKEELETLDNKTVTDKLNNHYNNISEEELMKDATRFLRIFFPEITEKELYMLDYGDGSGENGQFYEFVNAVFAYGEAEDHRALKN